jgi:hypothetical protein
LGDSGQYANFFFSPDVDAQAYNFQWINWINAPVNAANCFTDLENGYWTKNGTTPSATGTGEHIPGIIQDIANDEADDPGQTVLLMGASYGGGVAFDVANNLPTASRPYNVDLAMFDPIYSDNNFAIKPISNANVSAIDIRRNINLGLTSTFEVTPSGDGSAPTFPASTGNLTNLLFDPSVVPHPIVTMTPFFDLPTYASVNANYDNPSDNYTIQFVENAIYGQPLFPGA